MLPVPMYSPVGDHAQLTGLSAAKTVRVPNAANAVLIQATGQDVRIKLAGSATSGQGFVITADNPAVLIPVGGGSSFSIHEGTASATLEYQFVKVHGLS